MSTRKNKWLLWAVRLVCLIVCMSLINVFLVKAYTVNGSSMEPNFFDGDQVVTIRLPYHFNQKPEYKDVVVIDIKIDDERNKVVDASNRNPIQEIFDTETEGNDRWLKRIVGLPGDKIESRGDHLYRNGLKIDHEYFKGSDRSFSPVKVPDHHVFVVGDNLTTSMDSRHVGTIPIESVKGNVILNASSLKDGVVNVSD